MVKPYSTIEGADVVLRPTAEDDLELLCGWFARPDVVAFWGGRPLPEDEVAAKYLGRRRPAVECFVVLHRAEPVGLIQHHLDAERSGGIDMVLLEEHGRHGVGRAAVHALVEHLERELGWTEITVDPDDANVGGKAYWAAVGFEPVRTITDDPDRDAYVLMRRRGSISRSGST